MLNQALAIANGKGGVGKSSLTANLAAIAAHSGFRVLAVDLDPQGNLGSDLGYRQAGQSDEGSSLSRAIQFGEPLRPVVRDARPGLDAIPAGRSTGELAAVLHSRGQPGRFALAEVVEPLALDYDLIVFDCPPGDTVLGDLALVAARALLIPIKFDGGSLDGLEMMASRFADIKAGGVNPYLELLGIVLFDFNPQATALRRQVMDELTVDFGEHVRVFEAAIRHSQRAAFDMRRDGVVAIEYEAEAAADRASRLQMLRESIDRIRQAGPAKSQSATGLADDYTALAASVLAAFAALDDSPPSDPWLGSIRSAGALS